MPGIHAETAALIDDAAHIRQSIADLLSTPVGSRVMRRDYGSYIFRLIDQPASPSRRLKIMAAAADAIRRWESRITLDHLSLGADNEPSAAGGRFTLLIQGTLRTGERVAISSPIYGSAT